MVSKNTEKQGMRPRPLSPHLSVYKPQITSMLSITHRATGVFLLLGAFVFVAWISGVAWGGCQCVAALLQSWVGIALAFAWSGALFYHLFNGIRHLFWDVGLGYELKTVTRSGITVLLATAISLAIVWSQLWEKIS